MKIDKVQSSSTRSLVRSLACSLLHPLILAHCSLSESKFSVSLSVFSFPLPRLRGAVIHSILLGAGVEYTYFIIFRPQKNKFFISFYFFFVIIFSCAFIDLNCSCGAIVITHLNRFIWHFAFINFNLCQKCD